MIAAASGISWKSWHEAGHAVVVVAVQGTVRLADTNKVGRRGGQTLFLTPRGKVANIAIALAGSLAAWLAAGQPPGELERGASDDLKQVAEMAGTSDYLSTAMGRDGLNMALTVLRDRWGAVEAVAEWLNQHGQIKGSLVHAIVRRHDHKRKELN